MERTYSVTELTAYVRGLFDSDPNLQNLWVTGEVSNARKAPSGHWYFTLKDNNAAIKCVMWKSTAGYQIVLPQDGKALLANGRVGVYDVQGVYQLYVERLQPAGVGNLYLEFERLKAKLEEEGLFDYDRKRPLPGFPLTIGVVTSPQAAAFQDVLTVLSRRFPVAQVILSPTSVQGDAAPPQIVAALQRLNAHAQADVILLCRGGGSIEDLWAFNDEGVARAVAESDIPVITGVGHETDFTIVDFVSDYRAPTPSAAAEVAVPDIDDLRRDVQAQFEQIAALTSARIDRALGSLEVMHRRLEQASPTRRVAVLRQRVDDFNSRLVTAQRGRVRLLNERLEARRRALDAANPESLLKRGYAVVTWGADGARLASVNDVQPGDDISVRVHDGTVSAQVQETKKT